jgi:hypothetical protein
MPQLDILAYNCELIFFLSVFVFLYLVVLKYFVPMIIRRRLLYTIFVNSFISVTSIVLKQNENTIDSKEIFPDSATNLFFELLKMDNDNFDEVTATDDSFLDPQVFSFFIDELFSSIPLFCYFENGHNNIDNVDHIFFEYSNCGFVDFI